MKVLFLPEVEDYLYGLMEILYRKEYVGFKESAIKYIADLKNDIETTLHTRQKRPAPPYFERYSKNMYYAAFSRNRQTQWYVFFTVYEHESEIVYLVRYISNNHVIAQHL
jgi:hypothetical protein